MVDRVHFVDWEQRTALVVVVFRDMFIECLLIEFAYLRFLDDFWTDARLEHVISVERRVAHFRNHLDELRVVVLAYLIALE